MPVNPVLARTHTVQIINLPHDFLCPLQRRSDQLIRPWTTLRTAKQIVGSFHVHAGENRRHDSKHTLTTLVHARILYLRLLFV